MGGSPGKRRPLLVLLSVLLVGAVIVIFTGVVSGAAIPLVFLFASVLVLVLVFSTGERHR